MPFTPKQHLEIGNYIQYVDEILHKCEKGIEYCKICPNEFVCSELEKDDFGLKGITISDVLSAIQYALNKIPGYLRVDKRKELKDNIKIYINESPVQERNIWEDGIIDILLDNKLASATYKPVPQIGAVRTLLTCNPKISFSAYLRCSYVKNSNILHDKRDLRHEITSQSIKTVNQFIQSENIKIITPYITEHIRYYLEYGQSEALTGCNLNDIGLAAALCYYAVLTRSIISESIVVTGGLDNQGRVTQVGFLNSKIETVFRELHFINKIIIPRGSSTNISSPDNVNIIEVDNLKQAINIVFANP